jgi:hypothetical protein
VRSDLSAVSVLMPYRSDHGQRERLYRWVRARYRALMPEVEVCVAAPTDGSPYFSRASAINAAARRATRDVFLVADADVVAFPEALLLGLECLRAGAAWVLPYQDYVTLDEAGTERLLASPPGTHPLEVYRPVPEDYYVGSLSGLALVTREAFEAVGGFDERFHGWGHEDLAWSAALTTLRTPPVRVGTVNLYHLWHAFAPDADRNPERVEHPESRALYARYQAAAGDVGAMRALLHEGDTRPVKTYRLLGENGRLGNQLWQIASTLGIAAAERATVVLPPWRYARLFSLPPELFGEVPEGAEDTYDHPHEVVKRYRGYLQEQEFLAPVEERVRAYLQPSAATVERLRARQGWFFECGYHLTAVHVRRGDVLWPHAVGLFRLVGMDYYEAAMALARERHPSTRFVVFSDDIAWCREHLPPECAFVSPPGIPEAGSNPTDWVEFFLMRLCREHIIANSTFSWWAAWLSDNPSPIAPERWFDGDLEGTEKLFLPDSWTYL